MGAADERRFWNEAVETLPPERLRALQETRLRAQLAYNYERSPFHRRTFEAAGASPRDIRGLDDLARLPLTTKEDYRAAQEESLARYGNAYALFACAPAERIVRINATSGTTGTPTLYTLTTHDVGVVNEMHARKYWRAGIRPGHVMVQALSLSMFTGGLPLSQGIMHLGASVVPVGVEGGTARVLEYIRLTGARVIVATPSFGRYLIEECERRTGRPARELGLDWFFCAGEPGGGDAAVRSILAEGFGARVFDHVGGGHAFHAISCETPGSAYRGMHVVSADHCVLELVDPASKVPVAVEDGATGEMVWTFLDWEGGPFMRFAVGDVVEIATAPCPCGWPGPRVRIIGRADDMLIVKGVNVYPAAVQDAVLAFAPQVTGEMRILLDRPGPLVRPPLRLLIEHGAGVGEADLAGLAARIAARCRERLRVSPEIEWVPPGTLERAAHKARLIEIAPRSRHGNDTGKGRS